MLIYNQKMKIKYIKVSVVSVDFIPILILQKEADTTDTDTSVHL
jgi:hypothetical protein